MNTGGNLKCALPYSRTYAGAKNKGESAELTKRGGGTTCERDSQGNGEG